MNTRTGRPTRDAAQPHVDVRNWRGETLYASWKTRGACASRTPHWWDYDAPQELQEKARAACLDCPVFAECLADAGATEGDARVGRSNMRAGMTGQQRDWLHRQMRLGVEVDAEEARLLALESTVSGRPVKEIAKREGVGGLTLRLAMRLLPEEEQESGAGDEAKPPSRREQVLARMEEVLQWRADGMSLAEIAKRLGVSTHLASEVIKQYLGQDPGQPLTVCGRLSKAERAEQIIGFRRDGFTWKAIDEHLSQAEGTTYRFVDRYRSQLEERGEEVPREFQRSQAKLSEAQVVRIRERAAQGVTDLAQAMELGVNRKVVTDVASGETYRSYGGPIRPKRVNRPSAATRTLWNIGQPTAKAS
ncbi:WhiB family transcriptional regulator [Streptomyces lydicus]|uniref:WhiB family transcriptional regulator n=1 Tax=Streptomyces lydicus TaxID=47763 RepID=UPI003817AE04